MYVAASVPGRSLMSYWVIVVARGVPAKVAEPAKSSGGPGSKISPTIVVLTR